MAVMKLVYTSTEIEFDPSLGYRKPDVFRRVTQRAIDGSLYVYKYFKKLSWEIPIVFLEQYKSDQINTWWDSITLLDFYPDLVNSPATKYSIKIVNTERPLLEFSGIEWETFFKGTLYLEQV